MDGINLQTGINHFKSGNKNSARQVFLEIIKTEPNNEMAWLWLAASVEQPEQKRDCFNKVISINPNNSHAQKALAELEFQLLSESKPEVKSGAILKCPSCGSALGKPDHTGLIQCGYCGTTITYHPPVEKTERKSVERFLEMCKSALEGKNYDETLQYANKVLEIDPENIEGWINKAIATFWFTTEAKNRYDEAMGYIKKTENIAPNDERVLQARKEITYLQAQWHVHLGNEEIKRGEEEHRHISSRYTSGVLDLMTNQLEARNAKVMHFIEAMNHFLEAVAYVPDDISFMQNIESLAANAKMINWSDTVKENIRKLQMIRFKAEAERKLPGLKQELVQVQKKLAELKKRNSLFDAFKLDDAESREKWLKNEIARCEVALANKP